MDQSQSPAQTNHISPAPTNHIDDILVVASDSLQVGTPNGSSNQPNGAAEQNAVDSSSAAVSISTLKSYAMTRKPRGLCIIINNENFKGVAPASLKLDDRTGTKLDEEHLQMLFGQVLQFTVRVHNDLKSVEIEQVLLNVSKEDHSQYDTFACVILSHGIHGFVYGVEGVPVELGKLMSFFVSLHCPSLKEKPKMFFLQANQGGKRASDDMTTNSRQYCRNTIPGVATIPSEAHFLLSYSTVPGYVSYRSRSKGTWYIKSLKEMFMELYQREDLLSILIAVNFDVGLNHATDRCYRQSPAPICTITKKIYFQ